MKLGAEETEVRSWKQEVGKDGTQRNPVSSLQPLLFSYCFLLSAYCLLMFCGVTYAAVQEREPVTISIVAVNPSAERAQLVPIRIDLPQEVTSKDVISKGGLELEYDDKRSIYYVYKEGVALQPKETRIFRVTIRDLWFIPKGELDDLKNYTNILLGKLEGSTYYKTGKSWAVASIEKLDEIETSQADESISRKGRIGAYRYHRQAIERIKEDLARMEKLLTFTGGPPVPEMLEESPLKADAPSTTTTWLVIFLILVFISLLGGQFFFTWQKKTKAVLESDADQQIFPSGGPASSQQGPGSQAA